MPCLIALNVIALSACEKQSTVGTSRNSVISNDVGDRATTTQSKTGNVGSAPFEEITEKTGIEFSYSNGRSANEFAIVESLGGGLAAFDYDQNGEFDLLFAGGRTIG